MTSAQANCYANDFVGLHLDAVANHATFADLGTRQVELRTQLAALPPGSPVIASLQQQLDAVTAQRDVLFKGETLRSTLNSTYAYGSIGHHARQIAIVAYTAAAM